MKYTQFSQLVIFTPKRSSYIVLEGRGVRFFDRLFYGRYEFTREKDEIFARPGLVVAIFSGVDIPVVFFFSLKCRNIRRKINALRRTTVDAQSNIIPPKIISHATELYIDISLRIVEDHTQYLTRNTVAGTMAHILRKWSIFLREPSDDIVFDEYLEYARFRIFPSFSEDGEDSIGDTRKHFHRKRLHNRSGVFVFTMI